MDLHDRQGDNFYFYIEVGDCLEKPKKLIQKPIRSG